MYHVKSSADAVDPRDLLGTSLRAWYSAGSGHLKGSRAQSVQVPSVRNLCQGSSAFTATLTQATASQRPTYGGGRADELQLPFEFLASSQRFLTSGLVQWPATEASFFLIGRWGTTGNRGVCQLRNYTAGAGYVFVYAYGSEFSVQPVGTSGSAIDVRTGAGSITSGALTWLRIDVDGTDVTVSTEGGSGTGTLTASMNLSLGTSASEIYLGRSAGAYSDDEIYECMIMEQAPSASDWYSLIQWAAREYQQDWTAPGGAPA